MPCLRHAQTQLPKYAPCFAIVRFELGLGPSRVIQMDWPPAGARPPPPLSSLPPPPDHVRAASDSKSSMEKYDEPVRRSGFGGGAPPYQPMPTRRPPTSDALTERGSSDYQTNPFLDERHDESTYNSAASSGFLSPVGTGAPPLPARRGTSGTAPASPGGFRPPPPLPRRSPTMPAGRMPEAGESVDAPPPYSRNDEFKTETLNLPRPDGGRGGEI